MFLRCKRISVLLRELRGFRFSFPGVGGDIFSSNFVFFNMLVIFLPVFLFFFPVSFCRYLPLSPPPPPPSLSSSVLPYPPSSPLFTLPSRASFPPSPPSFLLPFLPSLPPSLSSQIRVDLPSAANSEGPVDGLGRSQRLHNGLRLRCVEGKTRVRKLGSWT